MLRFSKLFLLVVLCLPFLSHAQDSASGEDDWGLNDTLTGSIDAVPPGVKTYNLDECISLGLQNNGKIQAQREAIEAARWQKNEADAWMWPVVEYEYNMAPVPENVSRAFDSFFSGEVSLFNRMKIGLGLPVYTFGQLSLVEKMAGRGVDAAKEQKFKEDATVVSQIRQLYYGVQLGYEAQRLLEKAAGELRERVSKEEEKMEHSPMQLLQMKVFLLELEKQLYDAQDKTEFAREGLRIQMGLEKGAPVFLTSTRLREIPATLAKMEDYATVAMEWRPDARLVDIGADVKKMQYDLQKRQWFPRAGVGGFIEMGRTTSSIAGVTATDDFNNPFNFTRAGVGLEVKGKIDFHGNHARIQKAEREYHKALLEKAMAKEGIRLDIQNAYSTAKRQQTEVGRQEAMQSLGRRMLFIARSNQDVGLGDDKEFIDALKLLLVSRGEYFKAVYDFNLALAVLDEKIGIIPTSERNIPTPTKIGVREIAKEENLTLGPATEAVKSLDHQLSDYRMGKNLSEADREFNRQLKEKILHGTFDIRELSKRALGKNWDLRTPQEQDHFVDLLISILEEKSVSAKENSVQRGEGADYNIGYLGEKPIEAAGQQSLVRTKVHLPKENLTVKIDYKLKKVDGEWKIYDVVVDDASLIANYHYSFQKIIDTDGYPELVNRLQKKLDEIRGVPNVPAK